MDKIKAYKIVSQDKANHLVSAVLKETCLSQTYKNHSGLLYVERAMCFRTRIDAVNFMSHLIKEFHPWHFEIWKVDVDEIWDMTIMLSEPETHSYKFVMKFLKEVELGLAIKGASNLTISKSGFPLYNGLEVVPTSQGTILCSNVKLNKRLYVFEACVRGFRKE